jgi:hypothetical protein
MHAGEQLFSLVLLQFVQHPSGEEKAYTHRHTMSLYFFLELSASLLIQQFMVNRWI